MMLINLLICNRTIKSMNDVKFAYFFLSNIHTFVRHVELNILHANEPASGANELNGMHC